MEPSIATPRAGSLGRPSAVGRWIRALGIDRPAVWIGLAFVVVALVVYVASNPVRENRYNHFVWQADAFLHGSFGFPWPVSTGFPTNNYFQDVYPDPADPGRALIPFPPLPAVILLPFVAVFGLTTDAALITAVLGALTVGLAWRLALRLTTSLAVAGLATAFYSFGTVAWYSAMLGKTWFLAHVVSNMLLFLAITAAIDGERRSTSAAARDGVADRAAGIPPARGGPWAVLGSQFVAGLLFGAAALARLTTIFGAPFFLFVGRGRSMFERGFPAAVAAAIPVLLLLAYNFASTGHVFHPGYEFLYQHEYVPRPDMINRDWGIMDLRYVPQSLVVMLGWLPQFNPECGLSLLDRECPLLVPDAFGMSLLLASPGYLLALAVLSAAWRRRLVMGSALAVLAIAFANLMHFSQGWIQFGHRFSADFAPFAFVLVTLGIAQLGVRRLTVGLVAASVVITAWGVYWGVTNAW